MARLARVVAPGLPHHVTQRGNRRQQTFFEDKDYQTYIKLMAQWCSACFVEVWAYCLMPNHVHLIVVPKTEDGLRRALGEAHRRYTRGINLRQEWRGHLWQGRFASYALDEKHVLAAARYIELNPVRASLARRPEAYPWSSAAAHLRGIDDALVVTAPLLEMVGDWRTFLASGLDREDTELIRRHERTGRPLGDDTFLTRLESVLGRAFRPQKRGRKPSNETSKWVWCPRKYAAGKEWLDNERPVPYIDW